MNNFFLLMTSTIIQLKFGTVTKRGFSLCPKSGNVLASCGAKDVCYTTSSKKIQITTLVCINADIIPPIHIFTEVWFSYNPMEGCVDGAYFGKSSNRCMTQVLFYGWLTKHFISSISPDMSCLSSCGWLNITNWKRNSINKNH